MSGLRISGSEPVSATLVRSDSAARLPLPAQVKLRRPRSPEMPQKGPVPRCTADMS